MTKFGQGAEVRALYHNEYEWKHSINQKFAARFKINMYVYMLLFIILTLWAFRINILGSKDLHFHAYSGYNYLYFFILGNPTVILG